MLRPILFLNALPGRYKTGVRYTATDLEWEVAMSDPKSKFVKLAEAAAHLGTTKETLRLRIKKFLRTGDRRVIYPYQDAFQDEENRWWLVPGEPEPDERETELQDVLRMRTTPTLTKLARRLERQNEIIAHQQATLERLEGLISRSEGELADVTRATLSVLEALNKLADATAPLIEENRRLHDENMQLCATNERLQPVQTLWQIIVEKLRIPEDHLEQK
jgi:hypothetical protein